MKILFPVVFLSAFFAAGCVPLNQREISDLKGEVAELQIQLKDLQKRHADLFVKADSSYVTLDVLSASIKDLQNKVSMLAQNIQDIEVSSKKKRDGAKSETMIPSDIYQIAYSDYSMGKYGLAYEGFKSFVDKYPNSELAPQAQYFMGECFYSQSMWAQAVAEYKKVEQNYPRSDLTASARLKIALSYDLLGKRNEAISIFSSIVEDYPQSSEALTAKEKIRIYNNAQRK
ncbi:MAG: tol-pal system protein YbgF [Endomicrobia bacterium]|nr:tol-pal system protein YbgF [Endomicrobiia bacterium]MCL2799858.1 tol-pal system protein YbgF [Endomicrobiia bacterium]